MTYNYHGQDFLSTLYLTVTFIGIAGTVIAAIYFKRKHKTLFGLPSTLVINTMPHKKMQL